MPTTQNLWAGGTDGETDDKDDIILWKDDASPGAEPAMGEQLTEQQRQDVVQLLEEFKGVMCDSPGRTDKVKHDIDTATARPVRLPAYRLPHAYRDTVKKEIAEMLECGIIEPSSSEWSSPIVLVKKKDGTLRFCVDYRRLNGVLASDAYPMPRVDELIDRCGQSKFITTLDLTKGYWQVPLSERARHKTTFATPFGLYQFNVMPFGLQGAPATFQRLMDVALQGLDDFAASYIDDIAIFSETWEEHLQHIRQVSQRLVESNLTVKVRKCKFGMARCGYLGLKLASKKRELSAIEPTNNIRLYVATSSLCLMLETS